MTKLKLNLLIASVLVACASIAPAQVILTQTTLSSAVTTSSGTTIPLTSATGVTAPSITNPNLATTLYVDREAMAVQSVSGTNITVQRGAMGTAATSHASGALVFVVPNYQGTKFGYIPAASCTRSTEVVLPRIYFPGGIISDCLGGQWTQGDSSQTTRTLFSGFRYPEPGGTAYTALQTNGTAPAAATQIECSEFDLSVSGNLTGLAVLNGTTVGTDNHWVILYDGTGNVLANSAVAGAVTAGASTYQKYAFTSKFYAVGPARYFACYGSNGTTDTVRHAITGTNDNILGGAVTGQVFGTAAAITVPSTFTTAKAPYFLAY